MHFSGSSCLLITWKSNQEIENFKDLYGDTGSRSKNRGSSGGTEELVSEKSLAKNYRIIGKGEGLERLLLKGKLYRIYD